MNAHHQHLLRQFQSAEPGRGQTTQRPEHLGTSRRWYGLKNDQRRRIMLDFIAAHSRSATAKRTPALTQNNELVSLPRTTVCQNRELTYDEWIALIDALYRGESYEERCAPQTLFIKFPRYRRRLPLAQLDTWLGCLDGWAEVDSTCQSVFSAADMLADWPGWEALLSSLSRDPNVNKRRAALVLLTAPITKSTDERLLALSLRLIDRLKGETDKRITKAISWLLRKAIKQHRQAIEDYLNANEGALPAIALRETRKKLATGKK